MTASGPSPAEGPSAVQVGSALVRWALVRARAQRAQQLLLTLDPSEPAAWAVLEALREAVGTGVEQVTTRAAGGSVLVDVDLRLDVDPRERAAEPEVDEDVFGTDSATGFVVLAR